MLFTLQQHCATRYRWVFGRPFCKTVRPMLSDCCLSCLSNQRPRDQVLDPADQSVPGLRPGATRRTLSSGCCTTVRTRRPASADRTARRQFQATGQPVSRTQASDAITSRLPRYEAKCMQRRCFECGSVPLRSDVKGTELHPANILIPLERQLIALQLCR